MADDLPVEHNITLYGGMTHAFSHVEAVDLTGKTWLAQVRRSRVVGAAAPGEPLLEWVPDVSAAAAGTVRFELAGVDIRAVEPGVYYWDYKEVVDVDGNGPVFVAGTATVAGPVSVEAAP